jgi:hypothetical protein
MEAITNTTLCRLNMNMTDKAHRPMILPATYCHRAIGFGQNARLHPLIPVAPENAHRKQRSQKHRSYSNNVKSQFRHYPDNSFGIERLPVHHVIALITAANKKYKDGADNEHNDEALLPYFIRKRIFGNSDDGGKCFRHFQVNLSQALRTHLPAYRYP